MASVLYRFRFANIQHLNIITNDWMNHYQHSRIGTECNGTTQLYFIVADHYRTIMNSEIAIVYINILKNVYVIIIVIVYNNNNNIIHIHKHRNNHIQVSSYHGQHSETRIMVVHTSISDDKYDKCMTEINIIAFDINVERISIGIHPEHIPTTTRLMDDYGNMMLSIKHKLSRNKKQNYNIQKNGLIFKSMGDIKCMRLLIYSCVTTSDKKDITLHLQLNKLRILKHLSEEYDEYDLITHDDLKYMNSMTPTIYEWIINFYSFQTIIKSDSHNSNVKHKKLQHKRPLIGITQSKLEQYCYIKTQSIRNIFMNLLSLECMNECL
eukprot:118345_1